MANRKEEALLDPVNTSHLSSLIKHVRVVGIKNAKTETTHEKTETTKLKGRESNWKLNENPTEMKIDNP